MKLSEAIRLGSMLGPQAFGEFGDDNGGLCAFGAAYAAIGASLNCYATGFWPWLGKAGRCPDCGQTRTFAPIVSVHLNDKHRWIRERIADWVATVEPEEIAAQVESERVAEEVPA